MEEWKWLFDHLVVSGGVLSVGLFLGWLFTSRYLYAYTAKKGENHAMREDATQLTDLVKRVEHAYNELLEQTKAANQLRVAALDRRLQAHQESFKLWRNLRLDDSKDGSARAVLACQTWWDENCLYLEPQVREAFANAYVNEHLRSELVRMRADSESIIKAADIVNAFPDVLFKAVSLPTLSLVERQAVSEIVP
jgi:hypothetical protein